MEGVVEALLAMNIIEYFKKKIGIFQCRNYRETTFLCKSASYSRRKAVTQRFYADVCSYA